MCTCYNLWASYLLALPRLRWLVVHSHHAQPTCERLASWLVSYKIIPLFCFVLSSSHLPELGVGGDLILSHPDRTVLFGVVVQISPVRCRVSHFPRP